MVWLQSTQSLACRNSGWKEKLLFVGTEPDTYFKLSKSHGVVVLAYIKLRKSKRNCASEMVMVYLGAMTFDVTFPHQQRFLAHVSTLFPRTETVIIFSRLYVN